ncbi:SDR family oxidoreductase [Brevibacterium moorei]|uniref:SDR family oxidoreductase n=1 Tax=Brevibacterium moorei TaxID=2968457 RepID=UPI00211B8FA7|nr:SDR family oxidoreductase [Brevibacterium sp. 68QC2CO]MCQ9386815.1 SDR family oxidoreductase [Brevibacterium sp. 68QC2CO]
MQNAQAGGAGPFDIRGRLALVTGSSRGLGRTFALGLAAAGARVVVHGRDPRAIAGTESAIASAGGEAAGRLRVDLGRREELEAALAALVGEVGVPDILVNNAGVQRRGNFWEMDPADWDEVIAANLSAAFSVSRLLAPGMIERGSGKIVNIGSVQSMLARARITPYVASKGGIAMLTKGMASELAEHGIQVNTISPGYFATEMNASLAADPQFNAWIEDRTPARRWGREEELVGTLIYLCSGASDFVTGQNIFVDGGMTSVV